MAAKKTLVDEEEDPYDDVFLEELPEYISEVPYMLILLE